MNKQRSLRVLGWLVVLLGILFAALILAKLGAKEITPPEPLWEFVVPLAVGLACMVGSCVAIWNQKVAGWVLLASALAILLMRLIIASRLGPGHPSVRILASLLLFGVFWLTASRSGWRPVTSSQISPKQKIVFALMGFLLLIGLVVVASVVITMLPITLMGDCGWPTSFTAKRYAGHAVFTATFRDPGIAVVKERFWGLPVGGDRAVLVAHWGIGHNELNGRTYFIDGRRATGPITRFLPIIDISHCSRSSPLDQAALDVRILREGPSQKGVRIVGLVRGKDNQPRLGAKVVVAGPRGSVDTTTDSEGIFDLKDLQPGHYAVRIEGCDESKNPAFYRCSDDHASSLEEEDVWGIELRTN